MPEGVQQRMAFSSGLADGAKVLPADEPTGNLDGRTSDQVLKMLHDIAKIFAVSAGIATQNMALSKRIAMVVRLEGAKVIDASEPTGRTPRLPAGSRYWEWSA